MRKVNITLNGTLVLLPTLIFRAIFYGMSAYQVEVKKNINENNVSLLRRFSRKVMDTHIIQKVKGSRYAERAPSKLVVKNGAIRKIKRKAEYDRLKKLGKVQ